MIEPIITIRLPIADSQLSPNARIHYRKKAPITAAAKLVATNACILEMEPSGAWPLPRVWARETFYWPTKHRRDTRNAEARNKAYWDGIVLSGLIADDDYLHLTHLPTVFELDRKDPHLIIDIYDKEPE